MEGTIVYRRLKLEEVIRRICDDMDDEDIEGIVDKAMTYFDPRHYERMLQFLRQHNYDLYEKIVTIHENLEVIANLFNDEDEDEDNFWLHGIPLQYSFEVSEYPILRIKLEFKIMDEETGINWIPIEDIETDFVKCDLCDDLDIFMPTRDYLEHLADVHPVGRDEMMAAAG